MAGNTNQNNYDFSNVNKQEIYDRLNPNRQKNMFNPNPQNQSKSVLLENKPSFDPLGNLQNNIDKHFSKEAQNKMGMNVADNIKKFAEQQRQEQIKAQKLKEEQKRQKELEKQKRKEERDKKWSEGWNKFSTKVKDGFKKQMNEEEGGFGASNYVSSGINALNSMGNIWLGVEQLNLAKKQAQREQDQTEVENERYKAQVKRIKEATDNAADTASSLKSAQSNMSEPEERKEELPMERE